LTAVPRRLHHPTDGVHDELGPVELDVMGTVFRDDQLAVLREVRQSRLELVGLVLGPLCLPLRETRELARSRAQDDQGLVPKRRGGLNNSSSLLKSRVSLSSNPRSL